MGKALAFLFLLLAAASQAPDRQRVAEPPPAVKGEAANRADSTVESADNAVAPLPGRIVEEPNEAHRAQEREGNSTQHDAEDLDPQNRATSAAEAQWWPNWAGSILTFLGTVLIAVTLWETTRYNRRQLRAYVSFKIEVVPGTRTATGFKVKIRYINTGQTPAMNFSIATKMDVAPPRPPEEFFELKATVSPDRSVGCVGSGLEAGGPRNLRLKSDEYAAIRAGKLECFVFGVAEYDDIFGKHHFTRYRTRLYKDGGLEHFYSMPKGNSMT